jgi:hypothetical protein
MFRKLLTSAVMGVFMALSITAAFAANLPLLQGPWDPGNALGFLNQMVQGINSGVTGNLGEVITPFTTTANTIQTAGTVTVPGGAFTTPGQALHIRAFGVNDATSGDARTFTLSFGGSTVTQVVTGTSATWAVDCTVLITAVGASPAQQAECHGQEGTTVVASNQPAAFSVATGSAVTVLLELTAATAGTMTLNGAIVEQLK